MLIGSTYFFYFVFFATVILIITPTYIHPTTEGWCLRKNNERKLLLLLYFVANFRIYNTYTLTTWCMTPGRTLLHSPFGDLLKNIYGKAAEASSDKVPLSVTYELGKV